MPGKCGRVMLDKQLNDRISQAVRPGEDIDLDELVGVLRAVHPEYRRQKLNPFTRRVQELLDERCSDLPTVQPRHTAQESDSAVSDAPDAVPPSKLNSSITRMYNATHPSAPSISTGANNTHASADVTDDKMQVDTPGQPPGTSQAVAGHPQEGPTDAARQSQPEQERDKPGKSGKKRDKESTKSRAVKRARDSAGDAGPAAKKASIVTPKRIFYSDLGGIEDVLTDIKHLIEYPLNHPEVYAWLGVQPPRGVLLYGPPGCGKTALANAIATECDVPFLRISAPEVVSGMSGESEAKLRQLFADAAAAAPSILFIDEIDAIAPKRESAQREMERRIVAQMLTCMDDLTPATSAAPDNPDGGIDAPDGGQGSPEQLVAAAKHVAVIGATNRPDALDPALRRAGRFDREIPLGIPGESARADMLRVLCRGLRLGGNVDVHAVARATPGYVGADLSALTKEAAALAVARVFKGLEERAVAGAGAVDVEADMAQGVGQLPRGGRGGGGERRPLSASELESAAITAADFEGALAKVQPSIRREGFSTKPDVTWADVGSLENIKEELEFSISQPIRYPERFTALGVPVATGLLLFGPPGCGKTLVAKAAAADCGANFISIKGPELLNKYVGESERAIRQLFARARAAKPCVVFFDELDALAPRRGGGESNNAAERVVNQLLTELDGTESRGAVFVLAATNRPDMLDPALLRPGRLDKTLYVPLPDAQGRASIFAALAAKAPIAEDVDVRTFAAAPACDGLSGADLASLLREAAVSALKESLASAPPPDDTATGPAVPAAPVAPQIAAKHLQAALCVARPSVSRADRTLYDKLRDKLLSVRSNIAASVAVAPSEGALGGADGGGAAPGDESGPTPMEV